MNRELPSVEPKLQKIEQTAPLPVLMRLPEQLAPKDENILAQSSVAFHFPRLIFGFA